MCRGGAGAGQAIEDGYILARALHDGLVTKRVTGKDRLDQWTQLYQAVRLPRAQKAQATAREAGEVYEMKVESFRGLSYDDCMPIVKDRLKDRMKWVWTEDIDIAYESAKVTMGLEQAPG